MAWDVVIVVWRGVIIVVWHVVWLCHHTASPVVAVSDMQLEHGEQNTGYHR